MAVDIRKWNRFDSKVGKGFPDYKGRWRKIGVQFPNHLFEILRRKAAMDESSIAYQIRKYVQLGLDHDPL